MSGPMSGVRVVELGFFVAGPAAGGILADWGADVIKIEPPNGDPMRGFFSNAAGLDFPHNPSFELDNRAKRSIALNLETERGRQIAYELIKRADVFLTNLRLKALNKLGMDYETLRKLNPRLVYCLVTGFGSQGAEYGRPAYDIGAFWSRAGVVSTLTPAGHEPPIQRGAMGDHTTGMTAAGAISAALFARERTGQGQLVETSLLRVGAYFVSWDINLLLRLGYPTTPLTRHKVTNPLVNSYYDSEHHWFWMLGLQGDRHWPDLVRVIERPELLDDPRFNSMEARRKNAAELVDLLDGIFSRRPLAQWGPIFDREDLWWASVQTTDELVRDPQAREAGIFVKYPAADGEVETVATPVDFSATPWSIRAPSPECGQHCEEILLELGVGWEEIDRLRNAGVIP